MSVKLGPTGVAINEGTSRDGGRFAALTPAEVSTIVTTARAELANVPANDQAKWKSQLQNKLTELAAKPENAGVRGQLQQALKSFGLDAPAAATNTGWNATGAQKNRGVREVAQVQGPQLKELPKQPSITGNVELKDGKAFITTPSGKTMELVQPSTQKISPPMYPNWMLSGFADDGPVTVRGTLGSDGKFIVDDVCPGTSTQFTSGRVNEAAINEGKVIINTARGDVEVTNPDLKEVLLRAPRLGIILPGDPKVTEDGKMVYDQNPQAYYGLGGRAREVPEGPNHHTKYTAKVDGQDGKFVAMEDMAYSFFSNKPVYMDANSAARLDYNVRSLMLGRLKLTEDKSSLESFDAHYVSKNPENRSIAYSDASSTALPHDQAASMLGAQGFSQAARPGIDGFLWRNQPPAPAVVTPQ